MTQENTVAPPPAVDPPQPEGQGEYPITALIPSYIQVFSNQADYKEKTGKDAMSNPAIPIKSWIDTRHPASALITYNTAHLDASFQHPVTTPVQIASFLATIVNLPPDTGERDPAWATDGQYLTPIRDLLPNEKLNPRQMGLFDVVNLDIYNPFPPPVNPPPAGGGGFTDADRAVASQTMTLVSKIATEMGLS